MKTIFAAKFNKDLDKIEAEDVLEKIAQTIEQIEAAQKPADIHNIKKMKGFKNAFRIRIGNFRMGILIEKDTVKIARIALRKDIYDIFP